MVEASFYVMQQQGRWGYGDAEDGRGFRASDANTFEGALWFTEIAAIKAQGTGAHWTIYVPDTSGRYKVHSTMDDQFKS
ncbi:hypothetical protein DFO45_2287 [Azorhizobium sp. AG788]|uniref:hypothetical protein n=1 Tax=Azorhizobium sp. AG788 TaxID=2183897 RepID=UPI00105E3E19|nr:hypothetical protein [Azorhizobium sp. AG788]TDT94537.1 hypothetical protein DFO45_2287 [Azorhizobium sp. AG788]